MACPDANQIAAFVGGTLGRARADELAGHIDGCDACEELVRWSLCAAQSTLPASSSSPSLPSASPGRTFGRYILLDVIGRGGMGYVYAAFDPKLDRKVALKLLLDDDSAAGIEREAQLAARLQHPNIVAIYDVGAVGNRVYLAMEHVDGVTLAEWIAVRRPYREILDVFVQAARGLAAAHDAGLVHRDFKPSNVIVGDDGRVRVLDFGLARAVDRPDGAARPTAAWIGSPAYMAPEQLRGEPAGPAADQFAFCIALHEALHGVRPFSGDSLDELAANVVARTLVDPPHEPRVPAWLRRVMLRGLEVDPARRFASMDALITALRRDPTRARRVMLAVAAVVGIAGVGFATHARAVHEHVASCEADEQRVLDVVGLEAMQRIGSAFVATGAPFAASSTERTVAALDRYAHALGRSYHDSCMAGGSEVEVRDACYAERIAELDGLAGAFATADRVVVARATTAVGRLTPAAVCEAAHAPPIPDGAAPDLAARVARAQSTFRAGRLGPAREEATGILAAARARRDRRHEMDALMLLGQLDLEVSKPSTALSDAIEIGEALGRDADVELVLERLAFDAAQRGHDYAGAHRLQRLAAAKLERAGLATKRAGDVAALDGTILQMEDHLGPAEAALRRALVLQETTYGTDSPAVMVTLDRLAMVLTSQGRDAEAFAIDERAAAIRDAIYGPDHPRQVNGLTDLAASLNAMSRHDEALATLRRADDIARRTYGPDSAERFYTLDNIGLTEKNRADYAAATTSLVAALAIAEHALGVESAEAGEVHADLAEVACARGEFAAGAAGYERALAIVEHALGRDNRTVADILVGLGQSYIELHRAVAAVPLLERALRLRADDTPAKAAPLWFTLARALWDASIDRPRAIALARQAGSTALRHGEGVTPEQVASWLAAHDPR